METKPTAYHSLDEWVSKSQISAGATIYNPSVQDKKAPTAQPEKEDIDMEETSEIKLSDMSKTTVGISQSVSAETENMTECESENLRTPCEEAFPPPPPDFSDLPREEASDQDFSIEVIAVEWMDSDMSNPLHDMDITKKWHNDIEFQDATDVTNLTRESSKTNSEHITPSPPFADESEGEEMANLESFINLDSECNTSESTGVTLPVHVGDGLEQQVELSQQYVLQPVSDIQSRQEYLGDDYNVQVGDCVNIAEPKFMQCTVTDITVTTKSPPDCIVHSPLFVRENKADQEDDPNTLLNLNCKTDVSKFTASTSPVVDVSKQLEALSLQCELPFLALNQEATQQVLSQASPPLSTVSIEPANHTALSEGSAVVIGESRVRHGIEEGESWLISAEKRQYKVCQTEAQIRGVLKSNQEQKSEKSRRVSFQDCTMESDSCDESDSGVSDDFSLGSTLESSGSSARVQKETPIEREIRRAVEREHSLRRSRGLPNPPTAPQYVEIPLRKAAFCPSLTPTKSERGQGKDKLFAGKKMQQEIYEETRREQDLVKLGKIPGFYDKGTVRQLKERKQLFETFQQPNDSVKSKAISSSNDISILENDTLYNQVKKNGSDSRNELNFKTPEVFPEAKSRQIIIIENNLDFPSKRPNTNTDAITVVDSSKEKTRNVQNVTDVDLPPKENPFFKLRSPTSVVKVEQDIREAQERERELRNQRINLYGTRVEGEGGRTPAIEEHSSTLSSLKALPVQDLPDLSRNGVTSTTAARHSSGKIGVWPPTTTEKNQQTEVQHCHRIPRQKTPLVQRWESGLINAQDD